MDHEIQTYYVESFNITIVSDLTDTVDEQKQATKRKWKKAAMKRPCA